MTRASERFEVRNRLYQRVIDLLQIATSAPAAKNAGREEREADAAG